MGDLNLDFDIGTKNISVGDTGNDNLGFSTGGGDLIPNNNDSISPNLSVLDNSVDIDAAMNSLG